VHPAVTSTTLTTIGFRLAMFPEITEAGRILAIDDTRAPQSNAAVTQVTKAAKESVAPVPFAFRIVGQVLRVLITGFHTHLRSRAWLVVDGGLLLHQAKWAVYASEVEEGER